LLLTFFYRQMKELIERGHLYIAQPPLYKAKWSRAERYLKDDAELQRFLVERAVEKRRLRLPSGEELQGERLVSVLQQMESLSRLLAMFEKRGYPRSLVETLVRGGVQGPEAFSDKPRLQELIAPLKASGADIYLAEDPEHNAFEIVLAWSDNGSSRDVSVGDEFVSSPDYKTLYSTFEGIREVDRGPLVVVDGGEHPVADREELLAHILAEGRRGLTVSRYKGLGEMNADELWETTMNPDKRRLLQVRLEDEEVAENIFTTLMGDAVEPRRRFIEENALNVRNLDV
jgi:DNA gyrase subunit B